MEYLTRFIYTLIVIIISIPALSSVFIFFEIELEIYGSYMMWMAAVAIFSSLLAPNAEVPKLIKLIDRYLKLDTSKRVDTIDPLSTTAPIAPTALTAQVASNLVGNTTKYTTVIKNKSVWNNFLELVSMGDVTDKETIRKVNPIYSSPKNTSIVPMTPAKPGFFRRMYAWGTKPLVNVESKLVGNMTNANTGIKKKPITDVIWDMVSRGNVSDNETTSNVNPITNTQKNDKVAVVKKNSNTGNVSDNETTSNVKPITNTQKNDKVAVVKKTSNTSNIKKNLYSANNALGEAAMYSGIGDGINSAIRMTTTGVSGKSITSLLSFFQ